MNSRQAPEVVRKPGISGETADWRTLPNLLTALRILLIAPFVYAAVQGMDIIALGVWIAAGLTDLLDGYFARSLKQSSKLGRFADPVADKLLTGSAFVALSLFRDGRSAIPLWLMWAVILRDILILAGCLVVYGLSRSNRFRPKLLGKLNTFIEILVVTWFLSASAFPMWSPALATLYAVALISIVASAGDYSWQGIRMVRESTNED
ncbi:MAG TPA: CDP-alcohol phosphatidyltransferase family protein [Bryobacteraceae bacterium]|nr:CDP-alcohol phosphatidyltransferase family protein [Bryobacteraceae bacterium]